MARSAATDTLEIHRGKAVVGESPDTGSDDPVSGFFAFGYGDPQKPQPEHG
jgi:hypothetical protein